MLLLLVILLLFLFLLYLRPGVVFARLFASIIDIVLHDFGIGVAVVCDCFAQVSKVLPATVAAGVVVVVVAVAVAVADAVVVVVVVDDDFPARGKSG